MITAFAPATIANLSCGFDILGCAISNLGDKVTATFSNHKGLKIIKIEGDGGKLSLENDKNVCTVAVSAYLQHIGRDENIDLILKKGLPLGSGLGSSAASSVAALMAVNTLLGEPLKKEELLCFALEGEKAACGSAHADNVAPSLLGGITLIRDYYPLDIIKLPVPDNLFISLFHPHFELNTKDSRQVLKTTISYEDFRVQTGNLAGFISSLYEKNLNLFARCLKDVIAEPQRADLIPGFYELREQVLSLGALGSGISGSGPSIFVFCNTESVAKECINIGKKLYSKLQLPLDTHLTTIDFFGARIDEVL